MLSIPLLVSENKEFQEAYESFVESINELIGKCFSEPVMSLADAESCVFDGFRLLSQKFLEMFLSHQANEEANEPIDCPECGEACRPRYKRKRNVTTKCGVVQVERWVYGCANGHYHVAWDDKQKLRGQYTQEVIVAMCRLAAQLDFRAAAKELSHQGIKVSHQTIHQIVGEFSEDLNIPDQVEKQELEDHQRWYVSCDGCHTNSPEGWKEVKAGCAYRDYPVLSDSSDASSSARTESIRYVASRKDAARFGKELYELATQCGMYQVDIDKQEIVFIGDGAAWI